MLLNVWCYFVEKLRSIGEQLNIFYRDTVGGEGKINHTFEGNML